jgi:hypothetical protein
VVPNRPVRDAATAETFGEAFRAQRLRAVLLVVGLVRFSDVPTRRARGLLENAVKLEELAERVAFASICSRGLHHLGRLAASRIC